MYRGICAEVAKDLVDIAVKIAEYHQANDDHTPRFIWSDCRILFLKNQPIFEFTDYFDFLEVEDAEREEKEEEREDVNIQGKAKDDVTTSLEIKIKDEENAKNETSNETKNEQRTENKEERKKVEDEQKLKLLQLELDRQKVLADADFENYQDLASPWDQFVPTKEEGQGEGQDEAEKIFRLGRVVLGYVVHRLLEILYKQPNEVAARTPVPRVKVAAIVLNITNAASLEELRELLKRRDVHLVRMEDAINHCLEMYKREMADVEYIDLNDVSATTRDVGLRSQAAGKTNGPKDRRAKLPKQTTVKHMAAKQSEEKQTQTPRQIPYDDLHPTLSDTAYIGTYPLSSNFIHYTLSV